MTFATLLEQVGGMGRFQVINVTLLAVPMLFMACHNLLQNFTAAVPDHHCHVDVNATCGGNLTGGSDCRNLLRVSIPMDRRGAPHQCRQFLTSQWQLLNPNITGVEEAEAETEPCLAGWSYDGSVFASTIVTEWDLVCQFRTLKQMAQSIYMAGVLLGAVVFGSLSDKFGRKALLVWSYLLMAVSGSCAAFAPNFTVYCAFRFLSGMALSGIGLNAVSLSVEWTPVRSRAIVSMVTGYGYSVGQFVLVGAAYAVRDWRWLQMAMSFPFFLFFLYGWWFTESARWFATTGKMEKALRELRKVATINGRKEQGQKLSLEVLKAELQPEPPTTQTHFRVAELVRTPAVRRVTCCLCFVWFSTSFAYYGLAMDLQNFGLNIFLVQVIFGAIDIPAKLVAFAAICYLGRCVTQAATLILAGLSIAANIFVPQEMQTLRTVFAVFGKGCLAASFNCVFLYTGELYPTVIRQTGMGFGNTMARVGGIVAPLVRMTGEYSPALPLVIYGAAPIVSGIAAFFLPETLDRPLPDTIADVEQLNVEQHQREGNCAVKAFHPDSLCLEDTETFKDAAGSVGRVGNGS